MEWLVLIVVVAVLAGATALNHRTAAAAAEGVEFHVAAPPEAVTAALQSAYCSGARATLRSVVSRMAVTQVGPYSFDTRSSIGDTGTIDVDHAGDGSVVRAWTTSLYIGTPPAAQFRRGLLALSTVIVHRTCTLLGIAPNASRMKRFQRGVERKIAAQLRKAAA